MAMGTDLARAGGRRLERLRLLGALLQRVERQQQESQQERRVKSEGSSSKREDQCSKAVQAALAERNQAARRVMSQDLQRVERQQQQRRGRGYK